MPKVVPSQVVQVIDLNFPGAHSTPDFQISSNSTGVLKAIVRLIGELPSELLELGPEDYSDLVCAVESLSSVMERWQQRGGDDPPARIKNKSPVAVIREVLSKCPDERPSKNTAELA